MRLPDWTLEGYLPGGIHKTNWREIMNDASWTVTTAKFANLCWGLYGHTVTACARSSRIQKFGSVAG